MDYYEELYSTNQQIEIYAESVIKYIDSLQKIDEMSEDLFTEAVDVAKTSKSVIDKIKEAIRNIFTKLKSLFSKGKIKTKAIAQEKAVDSLEAYVQKISDVSIKIQNVWDFFKSVNKIIDEDIKRPNKKGISAMCKTRNSKKAIKELTSSLNLLSSQMRKPSSKQFIIEKNFKKLILKIGAVSAGGLSSLELFKKSVIDEEYLRHKLDDDIRYAEEKTRLNKKYIHDEYNKDISNLKNLDIDPDDIIKMRKEINNSRDIEMKEADKILNEYINDLLDQYKTDVKDVQNALNMLNTVVYAITASAELLAFFTSLPKKTGTENVTIGELYKRLTDLKASKVPSEMESISDSIGNYLQRTESLSQMANINIGDQDDKASVKFAQEVSALLSAYTNFYQTLIDFYTSIIKSVINVGKSASNKKIHKPDKIVNASKE